MLASYPALMDIKKNMNIISFPPSVKARYEVRIMHGWTEPNVMQCYDDNACIMYCCSKRSGSNIMSFSKCTYTHISEFVLREKIFSHNELSVSQSKGFM